MSSRSSRSGGGATQPSARRPIRKRSTRSVASRSSFFTRRLPQLLPSGWARCTLPPHSWITSAAQYHPYVASKITSGCSPALANSVARVTGSLSIRTVSRVSPDSVRRTMTLRRRCRSMPTYCCSCSTGVSFCRFRFGLVTPSVLRTPGSGRQEDSRWAFGLDRLDLATLFVGTEPFLMLGARAGALTQARHAGTALRSFITSVTPCLLRRTWNWSGAHKLPVQRTNRRILLRNYETGTGRGDEVDRRDRA